MMNITAQDHARLAEIHKRTRERLLAGASPRTNAAKMSRLVPNDHRVRVGFLTPVLSQGGTEEWHRQLLFHLDSDKVVLTGLVVTNQDDSHPPTYDLFASKIPIGVGIEAAQHLIDTSDIVVCWGRTDLSPLKIRPGMKIVAVGHGDGGSKWNREAMEVIAPYVTDWTAVSEVAYTPSGKHVVLANGCDLERVKPIRSRGDVRAELGFHDDDRIILHVGRLYNHDKHIDQLIHSVSPLPSNYKLVLIGDGHDEAEIIAQGERLLGNRFRHVHFTLAIGDYLDAADIAVLLSHSEGFGLVLAEYLAAGLPTISTPVGLAKTHPEAFQIIPIGCNVWTIFSAILAIDKDPSRIDRAIRGRELVETVYSTSAFVKRWHDYFVSIAPPNPIASRFPSRLQIQQVNLCLYRECRTGCEKSKCFAKLKGIQWGQEPYTEVTMRDCVSCLNDTMTAKQETP